MKATKRRVVTRAKIPAIFTTAFDSSARGHGWFDPTPSGTGSGAFREKACSTVSFWR